MLKQNLNIACSILLLIVTAIACAPATAPPTPIVAAIPTVPTATVPPVEDRVVSVEVTLDLPATSTATATIISTATAVPPTAAPTQTPFQTATPIILPTTTPAEELAPEATVSGEEIGFALSDAPKGWIAYVCYDGLDDEICVINSDGTEQRRLTFNDVEDYYPSFSNDGEWVAFARQMVDGSSAYFELYKISIDGSKVIPLTTNGSKNASPAYSWDDSQIVYTSKFGDWRHQIWMMDANGNNPRQLTFDGNNFDPAWSFDGEWISFASDRTGERQLWKMRPDGTEQQQITDVRRLGGRNDWSADDQYLFFYAGIRNVDRQIYRVDVDGRNVLALTNDGANAGPGTSRYGGWVAWQTGGDIWVARQDGADAFNLTNSDTFDYQPRWGP